MKPVSEIVNRLVAAILNENAWLPVDSMPRGSIVEVMFDDGTVTYGAFDATADLSEHKIRNWRPIGVA